MPQDDEPDEFTLQRRAERRAKWKVAGVIALCTLGFCGYVALTTKAPKQAGETCSDPKDCTTGTTCLITAKGNVCASNCGPNEKPSRCKSNETCDLADIVDASGATGAGMQYICEAK